MYGSLSQLPKIDDGAQRAPDEPLYLLRTPGLLAACRFAVHATSRRPRQHPVFRRHPALCSALQVRRLFFEHARSADHFRVSELDEHGTFRMSRIAARDPHRPELV
jgi:hypothetical protein